MDLPNQPAPLSGFTPTRSAQLMKKAQELETAFLSQMLSHAGLDAQAGPFGGGAGEDQFASLLRDAQAKAMQAHGGLGLAQNIFQSLVRHDASA